MVLSIKTVRELFDRLLRRGTSLLLSHRVFDFTPHSTQRGGLFLKIYIVSMNIVADFFAFAANETELSWGKYNNISDCSDSATCHC